MFDAPISADVPDWTRESPTCFWDPSKRLLKSIRRYQTWASRGGWIATIAKRRWILSHRFWSVVTGAEIPVNCEIAGGLLIPHPNGIVIHPDAVIGPNCLIFQQVTIGSNGKKVGLPTLEGHVDVGAGAKILGKLHVGQHARIGANSVVLQNVPAHATVGGIPAKILKISNESNYS